MLAGIDADLAWRIVLTLPLPFTAIAVRQGLRGMPGRILDGRGAAERSVGTRPASAPDVPVRAGRGDVPRRRVAARRTSLDLPGIVLLCGVVVLLLIPVLRTGTGGGVPAVLAPLGAGAAGIVLLIVWENLYRRRGRLPLFARELVRSRGFVTGNLTAMLWFGSTLSLSSVLTIHLLTLPDAHPLVIALLFAPGALARLVASLLSGRVHRLLRSWTVIIGLALQRILLVTLAVLAATTADDALPVIAASALVGLGIAGGIVEPPLRVVTLSFAPTHLHGVAASFLQLTQRLSATYLVALTTGILLGAAAAGTAMSLAAAIATCAVGAGAATAVGLDRSLRGAGRDSGRGGAGATVPVAASIAAGTPEASTTTV